MVSSILTQELQWNPSIMDTIGNQHFVPYSKVSLTQGLLVYFQKAWYCVILLLSTTWLRFQRFPLLYSGREGETDASNSTNLITVLNVKLLTTAAMVDNLAENVKCPLNQGR